MNLLQISHRLLSISSFGRTTRFIFKSDIKHIRSFHSSSIIFNASLFDKDVMNREKATWTSMLPSIRPDTSLTTVTINNQIIDKCKSLWKCVVHESKHYYNGFKLLFSESRIAFAILRRVLHGHALTRRERKQLTRTLVDLFRLVPFSVFIIVPFMEFTLPIFLKLFPNMLPSTFKHAELDVNKLKIKLEAAKFLQETVFKSQERAASNSLTIQHDQWMQKMHMSNTYSSIEEIIEFSLIFSNNLTVDTLARSQLVALCKLLNIPFRGPAHYLRLKLHLKFRQLKIDDQSIVSEGIENLNTKELQAACHERGMHSFDIDREYLRSQLQQWLDLHLNKSISVTTLLLSHAFDLLKTNGQLSFKVTNDHVDRSHEIKQTVTEDNILAVLHINETKKNTEQFVDLQLVENIRDLHNDLNACYTHSIDVQSTKTHCEHFIHLRQLTQTSHNRQHQIH